MKTRKAYSKMEHKCKRKKVNRLIPDCSDEFSRNCGFYFSRLINEPLVPPEMIQISLTHRCPLRCKMCTIARNPSKISQEMSTKEVKSIIDQASTMGIPEVYLTGGEPFIRKDCIKLLKYASSKNMKSSINTSAILINNGNAEEIVRSGIDVLTFSIDGMKENHDYLRGKGTFDNAINAIKLINEIKEKRKFKKPHIGISAIIMNQNIDDIMPLISLAESLNVERIMFQPVLVDNSKMFLRNSENNFWVVHERLNKLDSVLDEIEQYKNKSKTVIFSDTQMLKNYFRRSFSQKKCFVGFNRLFIGLWGNVGLVCPYDERNFAAIDSFRKNRLLDIWNSKKLLEARKVVKECDKECVQGCALKPESDDLLRIYNTTIEKTNTYNSKDSEIAEMLNEMLSSIEKYENILKLRVYNDADEMLIPEINCALKLTAIITEDIALKLSLLENSPAPKKDAQIDQLLKDDDKNYFIELNDKNKKIESELRKIRTSFAYKAIANPLDALCRRLK
jgi:MoaA/NifB/PqqE/SkfB family radical SAM enzyme